MAKVTSSISPPLSSLVSSLKISPCTTTRPLSLASSFISTGRSAMLRPMMGLPMAVSVICGKMDSGFFSGSGSFLGRGAAGLRSFFSLGAAGAEPSP